MPYSHHVSTTPRGRVTVVTDSDELAREIRAGLAVCDLVTEVQRVPLDSCTDVVPSQADDEIPDLVIVAAASAGENADCVREIREADARRLVPVVALCRSGDPDLFECLDAGANGLVPLDCEGGVHAAVAGTAAFWLRHNRLLRALDA